MIVVLCIQCISIIRGDAKLMCNEVAAVAVVISLIVVFTMVALVFVSLVVIANVTGLIV